jgi:hypothetical protein
MREARLIADIAESTMNQALKIDELRFAAREDKIGKLLEELREMKQQRLSAGG